MKKIRFENQIYYYNGDIPNYIKELIKQYRIKKIKNIYEKSST